MKKALMLAGVILCTSGVYAAETRDDQNAEGRKRNEEVVERMLEQTGWKNKKSAREEKPVPQNSHDQTLPLAQPKSS